MFSSAGQPILHKYPCRNSILKEKSPELPRWLLSFKFPKALFIYWKLHVIPRHILQKFS